MCYYEILCNWIFLHDYIFTDEPLAPYNVTLNINSEGYSLQWKVKNVPGRPPAAKILIEYRSSKSTDEWRVYIPPTSIYSAPARKRRSVESGLSIRQDELGSNKIQEFRVLAVGPNGERSKTEPVLTTQSGLFTVYCLNSNYKNYFLKTFQFQLQYKYLVRLQTVARKFKFIY